MSSEKVDAAKVAEGAPKELASRPKEKKEKAPKPNKNAGLEVHNLRPTPNERLEKNHINVTL